MSVQGRKSPVSSRRTRAFTLVEILMVVMILGMASAIIVPQISQRDDLKVTSAAREVMADIIYAQNRAIVTQTRQFVKFDIANKQYTLLSSFPTETILTHPVSKDPYISTFGSASKTGLKEITLVSAVFNNTQAVLGFDQLGTPLAVAPDGTSAALTSGTIVVQCGNYPLTITIEPYTGELTVQ
jgi:prepilin-type N-terminal cleavage/methylation domain-containing protein